MIPSNDTYLRYILFFAYFSYSREFDSSITSLSLLSYSRPDVYSQQAYNATAVIRQMRKLAMSGTNNMTSLDQPDVVSAESTSNSKQWLRCRDGWIEGLKERRGDPFQEELKSRDGSTRTNWKQRRQKEENAQKRLRKLKEAKKQRSKEAKKQRSKEAKIPLKRQTCSLSFLLLVCISISFRYRLLPHHSF